MTFRKYDVVWVDFPSYPGRVMCGTRPAIIVSSDAACEHCPVLMVAYGTTNLDGLDRFDGQVVIPASAGVGLTADTRFDCGHIMSIDTDSILSKQGSIKDTVYAANLDEGLREAFELPAYKEKWKSRKNFYVFCPTCGAFFVADGNKGTAVCRVCRTAIPFKDTHSYEVYCDSCDNTWSGYTNADKTAAPTAICKCGKEIPLRYVAESDCFV